MYQTYGIDQVTIVYSNLRQNTANFVRSLDQVDQLDPADYTIDKDPRQQINHRALEMIYDAIGNEVNICHGINAPLTLAGGIVPPERLLRGTRKKGDQVHQLLRFTTDVLKQMVDSFSDLGFLDYFVYDPVASGSLISPKQYEEFALPYTHELIDHIRSRGCRWISLHICGNTEKSLDKIVKTGVDAFSLDQRVDLEVAKELVGDKVTLIGNIDPVSVFLQGSPAQMDAAVKEVIDKAADNPRGFIPSGGCGIPKEVPRENMDAFTAAVRKYGAGSLKA